MIQLTDTDRKLLGADEAALLACWVGLVGVASYVSFVVLQENGFGAVCPGSWQERLMLVLRDLPLYSSPAALVLALFALWRPTRRRILASFRLLCSLFSATSVFALGVTTGFC